MSYVKIITVSFTINRRNIQVVIIDSDIFNIFFVTHSHGKPIFFLLLRLVLSIKNIRIYDTD